MLRSCRSPIIVSADTRTKRKDGQSITDMAREALQVERIAKRPDKLSSQMAFALFTSARARGSSRAVARPLSRRAKRAAIGIVSSAGAHL